MGEILDKIGGGGRLTALLTKAFEAFKSATKSELDKILDYSKVLLLGVKA